MGKSKKAAPQGHPALDTTEQKSEVAVTPLKIAIVGTASSSSGEAPWKDESWKIWSLGRNSDICPRFDQWFELHTRDVLMAANALDDKRIEFFKKAGDKMIVGHAIWPELPQAKLYPWHEVIHKFGRYLTSSLAEMIALAILWNPAEIGMWGVDMVCRDEYDHQRACCEHLLGIAKGLGIKVTVAKESPILRGTRIYALEDAGFSREIIERKAELLVQLREEEQKYNTARENVNLMRGQLSLLTDLETRWG